MDRIDQVGKNVMSRKIRKIAGRFKARVHVRIRALKFRSAVKKLESLQHVGDVSEPLLKQLILGWDNEAWSGSVSFLRASLEAVARTDGPILECGSGLSTILLGWTAKRSRRSLFVLEHSPQWAKAVGEHVLRLGLDNVTICHADLRDFGGYDWYDAPLDDLPRNFGLVICDGPPGDTLGGRYGLFPIMQSHLAPHCEVLLDDAGRGAEQAILARWRPEFGINYQLIDQEGTVGLIRFE